MILSEPRMQDLPYSYGRSRMSSPSALHPRSTQSILRQHCQNTHNATIPTASNHSKMKMRHMSIIEREEGYRDIRHFLSGDVEFKSGVVTHVRVTVRFREKGRRFPGSIAPPRSRSQGARALVPRFPKPSLFDVCEFR